VTTAYYVLPELRKSVHAGGGYLQADSKGRFAVTAGSADEAALIADGAVPINGGGQILGDALASAGSGATAGAVGEYFEKKVLVGAAIALTTATPAQIAALALPAGDFDVSGFLGFVAAATTNITLLQGGSSATSASIDSGANFTARAAAAGLVIGANSTETPLPTVRYSSQSPQTIYLNANAVFTLAALTAYGTLRARRAG